MGLLTKVISSTVESGRRIVKALGYGKDDIRTGTEVAPFGVDSVPPKGMRALYLKTTQDGKPVIVGYINTSQVANPGEHRIYSLKNDGSVSTFVFLRTDETMELGGDANFAVKFNELKLVADELKQDITTLKNAFTAWVVAPGDGGAALKAAAATWAGTALQQNIDDAKNDKIKTI